MVQHLQHKRDAVIDLMQRGELPLAAKAGT